MPQPTAHFSQAIAIEAKGRLVFVSGMTARRPDGSIAGIGDVEGQTRQVCENIKAALEAAGAKMSDVCRIDVHLRNIGDRERFNKVRRENRPTPRRPRRWSKSRSSPRRSTWWKSLLLP